jgi:hypothetical protein
VGLASKEAARLANIDQLLEQDETRQADLIDAHEDERLARIDAGLARVEKAIQELRALKTQ